MLLIGKSAVSVVIAMMISAAKVAAGITVVTKPGF